MYKKFKLHLLVFALLFGYEAVNGMDPFIETPTIDTPLCSQVQIPERFVDELLHQPMSFFTAPLFRLQQARISVPQDLIGMIRQYTVWPSEIDWAFCGRGDDEVVAILKSKKPHEMKCNLIRAHCNPPAPYDVLRYNLDAVRQPQGVTLLTEMVSAGNAAAVKVLIACGANPEPELELSSSPLIQAVRLGYIDIVQMLLAAGAHPNSARNSCALWYAHAAGNDQMGDLLMNYGATEIRPPFARTLAWWIQSKRETKKEEDLPWCSSPTLLPHPDTIIELKAEDDVPELQRGIAEMNELPFIQLFKIDKMINNPFSRFVPLSPEVLAMIRNFAGAYELELERASRRQGEDRVTSILKSALPHELKCRIVRAYCKPQDGIAPYDLEGNVPLIIQMIQQRNVDAVKVLIDCGVDLTTTKSGFPPLVLAAILGSDEIVRLLLEACVNPNENKNFIALIYAAWTGNAKMVKHLLEHGADRYAVHNGQTYLHLAIDCASAGSFYDETIALLINGNEHLDAPITLEGFVNGVTALYLAAFTNNISALRLLLQAGAQPNRARTDGMTPLFIAAQRGNAEAVELLLQNSAFTETCVEWAHSSLYSRSVAVILE